MPPQAPDWNLWASRVIFNLGPDWRDPAIRLLKTILSNRRTNLDQDHHYAWMAFLDLARHNPDAACGLLTDVLARYTEDWPIDPSIKIEDKTSLGPKGYTFSEVIRLLSTKTPTRFLSATLRWTVERMEATSEELDSGLYKTRYTLWQDHGIHDDGPASLVGAIKLATRAIAEKSPDDLIPFADIIIETDLLPLHVALAAAYAGNPTRFAATAAAYLASDVRRLRLGNTSDLHVTSKHLLTACSPQWSVDEAARVEKAILSAEPIGKPQSVDDLRRGGTERLQLLASIDEKKLSHEGRKALAELNRKFPEFVEPDPEFTRGGFVGPPIPENELDRLTDEGWIGAMKAYADMKPHDNRIFSLRGGRVELSHALEARAAKNTDRFLKLAETLMDSSVHSAYRRAIICGLAKGKAPIDRLFALAEKFIPDIPVPELHWVASAISEYPPNEIPERFIAYLRGWALTAADPKPDEPHVIQSEKESRREFLTDGLNSTRGGALYALGKIYLHSSPPRVQDFLSVAEEVAKDPAVSVRAVCLNFMAYCIAADPLRGFAIFTELIDGHPELLREIEGQECMYRSLHRYAELMIPAITRLMEDSNAECREGAARLACLAAFETEKANQIRDRAISGDQPLRKGAATVYSANVSDSRVGAECKTRLLSLFNDPDEPVRSKATDFMRRLDADHLVALSDFLLAWAATKSVLEGAGDITYALNKFPTANAKLTLAVAEKIIDAFAAPGSEISVRQGWLIPHQLMPALLNVYRHSGDIDTRRKALDQFERLEAVNSSEVSRAYESFDRS